MREGIMTEIDTVAKILLGNILMDTVLHEDDTEHKGQTTMGIMDMNH